MNGKAYSVQDTVTIKAIQDNTLYEDAGGLISNGQGKYMFAGKNNSGLIRRAILRFLLVEFMPPCSRVLNVSLKMHVSGGDPANRNIQLRKIQENWSEGNSDAPGLEENGTAASGFDATWIHRYFNTDYWSSSGGTFSTTSRGSNIVGGPGYYTWSSTPEMVYDAQEWLNDNSKSFGWMLLGDESASSNVKRFHTTETDTVEFIPELTIIYETSVFELYMESLIEGFWDGTEMVEDTVTVKLHNSVSPYNIVDSSSSIVGTYGGSFCFFNAPPGDYYISVHHRNTIETWSSLPLTFNLNGFEYYNFKDAVSKAYGNNQVLKLTKYCFYGGDVDQNGLVDATDLLSIFNDANSFVTGYVTTDVTGDNLVDVTDVLIAFNNANKFVSVIHP